MFKMYEAKNVNLIKTDAKLVSISFSKYEQDFASIFHAHPDSCEIMFVKEGDGELSTINQNIPMVKGHIYLINPKTLHTEIKSNKNTPLEYYTIVAKELKFDITTKKETDISEELTVGKTSVFEIETSINQATFFLSLFEKIFYELKNAQDFVVNCAQNYFEILLANLSRTESIRFTEHTLPRKLTSRMHYVKEYLDSYYNRAIDLGELADKLAISYSTLYHNFKKEFGISPQRYILKKQLETAISLLSESDITVSQVAIAIGFNDFSYFSRIFKKEYGVSPKEYRKNTTPPQLK